MSKEFSLLRYNREDNNNSVWVEVLIEDYSWVRRYVKHTPNIIQLPSNGLMSDCGLQLVDDIDKAYQFRDGVEDDEFIKKLLLKYVQVEEIRSTRKMGDIEDETSL